MWIRILGWILPYWEMFKKWINPTKITIGVGVVAFVIVSYTMYSSWKTNKELVDIKRENIAILKQHIEDLKVINKNNEKILTEKEAEYNRSLKAIKSLHVDSIKRERKYAKIKKQIKNDKDGNLSDVLRNAINQLRKTADSYQNSANNDDSTR